MFEEELMEMTTKLSGIILKKAEMENDFDRVYSMVFERMNGMEAVTGDEFLVLLGNIGG